MGLIIPIVGKDVALARTHSEIVHRNIIFKSRALESTQWYLVG